MTKSIRLLFHQCLVITILMGASLARAAVSNDGETSDGMIDVHYSAEPLAPFKERRSNWGTNFSIGLDNFLPDKFRSKIDGTTYDALFGSAPVPLAQISVGTKYNFSLGSLGAGLIYSIGQIEDSRIGETTKLSIQKKGVSLTYTMDNLFSEPYVAPYVSGQFFNIDYSEEGTTLSDSGSTAFSTGITVGALVQLNALDPESALYARNMLGLNNTYLNIYLSQYNTSGSEDDPNFETTFNWGAGFFLEF